MERFSQQKPCSRSMDNLDIINDYEFGYDKNQYWYVVVSFIKIFYKFNLQKSNILYIYYYSRIFLNTNIINSPDS